MARKNASASKSTKSTKTAAAQPAAKAIAPKQGKSINAIAFSGRVCEKGLSISKGVARFTLAHNMGPKAKPVFANVVFFPKNGNKDVAFDETLIKRGMPVVVKGYLRNGDRQYTPKDAPEGAEAKNFRQLDIVGLELISNVAE